MIDYVGEHLWAGQLGHTLAIVSLVGAVLGTLGYFLGTTWKSVEWANLGRIGFRLHSVAVVGIVVTLFTMLFNHWFEYDYVWKHSNLAMPMKYIASCFWEGQEGSFLLWTFWHMVLGNILILRAREWEAPVMTIVALVQVFLAFMLLGIYFGEVRMGSSPFLLIRELPENIGLPWTGMATYLSAIPQFADGRGLNPLLQNYWMVIHPPTLFLGFAATLVPFAYAIAGLWRRDKQGWITPALPWTFFGIMVLGTGILMGGAWAYEALSFGGFWAWDPVENASLVPWITLVGAGHLMLVNKRKPTALFSVFLMVLLTFILILYSTFLTRSGVLGDTSVHSFTGDGMLPALVRFLLIFIGISAAMLHPQRSQRWFYVGISSVLMVLGIALEKEVPAILLFGAITLIHIVQAYRLDFTSKEPEESLWSREFWLFIGSLVLLLSAAQITFSTSVPVFNILLEPFGSAFAWLGEKTGSDFFTGLADARLAPPGKAIEHYNKWQVPFAFIITMLVAFTQYLRWKDSDRRKFLRQIGLSLALAVGITVIGVIVLEYTLAELTLVALLFSASFALVANLLYVPSVLKGSLKNAGASVAHVGFAMVMMGALISNSRQQEVSRNTGDMDLRFLNEGFDNNEDLLLYRGDTVRMGDHYIHYKEKSQEGVNVSYAMDYFAVEPRTYEAGDTARVGDMLFRARDTHKAGQYFLEDQPEHWEPLEEFTRRTLWHATEWSGSKPGERLFGLSPFIQLNPRFGNVAEPSTKHWLQRDLYTHVRYADMTMASDTADDTWMPDRLYDKVVGDTIITPSALAIIDSVTMVADSVVKRRLGDRFVVYTAHIRVRDLYQRDRWFLAEPIVIYADGQPVAGKAAELEALRIKYSLATVDRTTTPAMGHSGPIPGGGKELWKIGLNVAESEFLVLQAIVFPGINILWIGCVLLFLGTLMAIRQRVKK
ncbi:MAG TPA: cytochrome c biogenesis protein CcsA [Flavobacteriales bacterium]|nr:cytochrome c biogenesis protein CcsA [Flavobacteriales bacterium]